MRRGVVTTMIKLYKYKHVCVVKLIILEIYINTNDTIGIFCHSGSTPNCGVLWPQIFSLVTIKLTLPDHFVPVCYPRSNLCELDVITCSLFFYGQRLQYFRGPKEPICVRSPLQFVVAKGPNLWKVTEPEENGHSTHTTVTSNQAMILFFLLANITINILAYLLSHIKISCGQRTHIIYRVLQPHLNEIYDNKKTRFHGPRRC